MADLAILDLAVRQVLPCFPLSSDGILYIAIERYSVGVRVTTMEPPIVRAVRRQYLYLRMKGRYQGDTRVPDRSDFAV